MVSTAGMTWPAIAWVCSLYCLQNSMMFTPCCPRAVPTGGAGVACAALICRVTVASTFFFFGGTCFTPSCGPSGRIGPASRSSRLRGPSDLRYLVEGQLDRGFPVEDVDAEDLVLHLHRVDL